MTIEILTVLPELLESPFAHSIMKRAQERGHLHIKLHQLRNWAINKHGQVDDYQYGGGAGMVIMCEPLANAIDDLQKEGGAVDEIIEPSATRTALARALAAAPHRRGHPDDGRRAEAGPATAARAAGDQEEPARQALRRLTLRRLRAARATRPPRRRGPARAASRASARARRARSGRRPGPRSARTAAGCPRAARAAAAGAGG